MLYVGEGGSTRKQVVNALEPAYRVTTTSVEDSESLLETIDTEIDCLVVAEGFQDGSATSLFESAAARWPDLPVVPFVSSAEIDDSEWGSSLLRAGVADIVYRDRDRDGGQAADPPAVRLRNRIDGLYEVSTSDVGDVVLEIARSLMGAAHDEIDIEIEWGLESVGKRLDVDRCLVFDYDDESDRLEPTHSWFAHTDTADGPDSLSASSFPGFDDALSAFDAHAIPAETELESPAEPEIDVPEGFIGDLGSAETDEDGVTHPYLEQRGLEALLAVPIVIDWELTGILVVGQTHRRPWPQRVRRQLRTLGELIGHTLERRRRRQELVRKNERLERFTSVISHDLRNPLNVVSGTAELVVETGDPEYAENVVEAADRMEAMIDDLLTLAREGNELGDLERVDLESLVEDAWNDVDTREATLETADLPTLKADPGRLRQVLENLIRNAVEHNRADVSVRVEGFETGFAVDDDGDGIPAEKRDRIFEEGYTDDNGTGLGLSIVETVVSAHGWDVSATESERGGARFEIVTQTADR